MDSIIIYLKESYNELVHKVTWPTWPSLLSSTWLVIVGSILIALTILVIDIFAKGFVTTLYNFS